MVVIKTDGATGYIIKRIYRLGNQLVDAWDDPQFWKVTQGAYRVPSGMAFVLGDNYPVSEDSRKFGPVPLNRIVGKVVQLP